MNCKSVPANEAIRLLKEGNEKYLKNSAPCGDVSEARRLSTGKNGQTPYAVIIGCSDSRVIPEVVFSAGIGDLFVIRVAGNVIDNHQLGSVEYAVEHLGCKLVVVLGHTNCGAVAATFDNHGGGHVLSILDEIKQAIGGETDKLKATRLNVLRSVFAIKNNIKADDLEVVGAIYDVESGEVNFDL